MKEKREEEKTVFVKLLKTRTKLRMLRVVCRWRWVCVARSERQDRQEGTK